MGRGLRYEVDTRLDPVELRVALPAANPLDHAYDTCLKRSSSRRFMVQLCVVCPLRKNHEIQSRLFAGVEP
jgi:hypothetical protein